MSIDRKSFIASMTTPPIHEEFKSKFVKNPNILKIYDEALLRTKGSYSVKVRLLPVDTQNPVQVPPTKKYHHWGNGKSFRTVSCTGNYFDCPICQERKARKNDDPDIKEGVSSMRTDTYINCYVISNPADRSSEGKVMILKMPAKVVSLFEQATSGDRKEEYGSARVMSLERGSVTLVMVVSYAKNRITYDESYFMSPEASYRDIETLTEEDKDKIWEQCFNIKEELRDTLAVESRDDIIKKYINEYLIPRGMTPSTKEVMSHFPAIEKKDFPIDSSESKPDDDPCDICNVDKCDASSSIDSVTSSELDEILNN